MPIVRLSGRSLVNVSGADADHLLQNIITTDLDTLGEGQLKPGALLTPQGKILFDFLISRDGKDGFRLDCRSDVADDFVRRLMLYRLRAKADISKQEQADIVVEWQTDSGPSQSDSSPRDRAGGLLDSRFKDAAVSRRYGGGDALAGDAVKSWTRLRIEHGIAESGADYALGEAFPHDVLLDETDGVGFKKGCYVGQEVVSRMHHRGTARRRVLIASGAGSLPAAGTSLIANGRDVGSLGSVEGDKALAIARIDRVKDAIDAGVPILAADMPVGLAIPAWAKFSFPIPSTAESA